MYNYNETIHYILGWGLMRYPGNSATTLQQTSLTTVSQSDCQKKLDSAPGKPGGKITNNMICASSVKGASACHGDSGGPFVCKNNSGQWILRGVVSWGSAR